MKKIAFMAHGPGSANALKPLITRCERDKNFVVELYAFHPFVATLWGCEERQKATYTSLFESDCDYIIYGTGSNHDMERMIPFYAKEKGIKTISILDAFWCDVANYQGRYEYPPDILFVPEETSKRVIVENKILPEENVLAYGNPHFDRLGSFQVDTVDIKPPYDVVVFSQPRATSDYSETAENVKECLFSLSEVKQTTTLVQSVTVTPHPREDKAWLNKFCREHGFLLETKRPSFDLLLEKDVNMGIHCTLQYESLMIGKPTIFYKSKEQLLKQLNTPSFWVDEQVKMAFNATERIFYWLKENE